MPDIALINVSRKLSEMNMNVTDNVHYYNLGLFTKFNRDHAQYRELTLDCTRMNEDSPMTFVYWALATNLLM